ncbi:tRNA-modifying protein YgfZ [Buchnera aphidicola]|uniref:tRNA-modifying protein YgfZ n=1 Tax=Buchnera aphidicola TaxID=9 RepID=UPI00094D0ECC|nr:tRNA-modifying protein YgfZ [Buchnera aphidicola]
MTVLNTYHNTVFLNKQLPATIMQLKNWCIINVIGMDSIKYLNQQFTLDINTVHKTRYQFGAHCNYNGKVWCPFLIFKYNNIYAYLIRTEIALKQMKELKKYSVFSDINIFVNKNWKIFGVAGFGILNILTKYFTELPNSNHNIMYYKKIIVLRLSFPSERFLIICKNKYSYDFIKKIAINMFISTDLQWKSLDIESNFPIINNITIGRFLPQSLNLKYWNALCFNKGCYYGQEILYRYEKQKINKFKMKVLIGESKVFPIIGSWIEYHENIENICNAGIILEVVQLLKNKILLQVCMKKIFCKEKKSFYISGKYSSKFVFFS